MKKQLIKKALAIILVLLCIIPFSPSAKDIEASALTNYHVNVNGKIYDLNGNYIGTALSFSYNTYSSVYFGSSGTGIVKYNGSNVWTVSVNLRTCAGDRYDVLYGIKRSNGAKVSLCSIYQEGIRFSATLVNGADAETAYVPAFAYANRKTVDIKVTTNAPFYCSTPKWGLSEQADLFFEGNLATTNYFGAYQDYGKTKTYTVSYLFYNKINETGTGKKYYITVNSMGVAKTFTVIQQPLKYEYVQKYLINWGFIQIPYGKQPMDTLTLTSCSDNIWFYDSSDLMKATYYGEVNEFYPKVFSSITSLLKKADVKVWTEKDSDNNDITKLGFRDTSNENAKDYNDVGESKILFTDDLSAFQISFKDSLFGFITVKSDFKLVQ